VRFRNGFCASSLFPFTSLLPFFVFFEAIVPLSSSRAAHAMNSIFTESCSLLRRLSRNGALGSSAPLHFERKDSGHAFGIRVR
jgi:hypothetical protein